MHHNKPLTQVRRHSKLIFPACYLCLGSFLLPLQLSAATIADSDHRMQQLEQQIQQQQQQIDELRQQYADSPQQPGAAEQDDNGATLDLAGFFDVTAHTTDNSEHPFDLGSLELDIQYDQAEHFSVSTALVWDGDASEVAVALLDYHVNSHTVPTRGRLFGEPGYHVQFGRFDIPFGIDYEFFAAPDRPNVTAPLTTQRIQNDGLNGDGLRMYGSWSQLDYALYWTNSLFEDNGTSVGTRLGFFPGRNPYRVHNRESQNDFIIGLSWLRDMDSDEHRRNTLHAIDISWRYAMAELVVEYVSKDNIDEIVIAGTGSVGPADESGYNARLLLDFDPMAVFIGYGEWQPDYTAIPDADDPSISYNVETLKRLTLGGRYVLDDYLQIKLEYLSHLDTSTAEPDFEKRRLTFQMVASF